MYGKNNARLFTSIDTANGDFITTKCKRDPKFRKWLEKINNKIVLKELKKDKWGDLIYPSRNRRGYEKRVIAKERKQHKDDFKRSGEIFNAVIKKRQTISLKNRKNARQKRIKAQRTRK